MGAKGATGVWKARVETSNSGREMKMNCIWSETKAKGFPDSRKMLHNFIVPPDKPCYCFMFCERPRGNLKLFMRECSTQHHVETGERSFVILIFCFVPREGQRPAFRWTSIIHQTNYSKPESPTRVYTFWHQFVMPRRQRTFVSNWFVNRLDIINF